MASVRLEPLTLPRLATGGDGVTGKPARLSLASVPEVAPEVSLPVSSRKPGALEPATPPASPQGPEVIQDVDKYVKAAFDRTIDTIQLGDVRRDPKLRQELSKLTITEHFTPRGTARFRGLGLAFVSKHQASQQTFGTEVISNPAENTRQGGVMSAKACMLASAAREKDLEQGKVRTRALLQSIKENQKCQAADVMARRRELLFRNIPCFEGYLPPGVHVTDDMLLGDFDPAMEQRNRRLFIGPNAHLGDQSWRMATELQWIFTQAEVIYLSLIAGLWTTATRSSISALGMDRPTFCMFLLDVGLVDQLKVPFFWAVSLFDEVSHLVYCPVSDATAPQAAPAYVCSRWHLIAVLDLILRQYCFTPATKKRFLGSLLAIAKLRLPAYVIEESGLTEDTRQSLCAGATPAAIVPEAPKMNTAISTASPPSSAAARVAAREREAANRLVIRRAEDMRDRLVRSMMVEPEVLQVLLQHREVFARMFACYSDDGTGAGMSFRMFFQFCKDFQLLPHLVSSQTLKELYRSAKCVQVEERDVPILDLEHNEIVQKRGGSRHNIGMHSRASSFSKGGSSPGLSQRGSPIEPQAVPWAWKAIAALTSDSKKAVIPKPRLSQAPFGVSAFVETLCRAVFLYLGEFGNHQQRCTDGYTRVIWLVTYLHYVWDHLRQSLERRSAVSPAPEPPHPQLVAVLRELTPDMWENPEFHSCPQLSPTEVRVTLHQRVASLGVNAAQEMFLATSGPADLDQPPGASNRLTVGSRRGGDGRGTPRARGRTLSLTADSGYTCAPSASFSSLQTDSSASSDEDEEDETESPTPLLPAVGLPSLRESRVRALPSVTKALLRFKARRDVEPRHPLGAPCVEDGSCKICSREAVRGSWGNPRCRGCSEVDVVSFNEHPLKRMLFDVQPRVPLPQVQLPAHARPLALSPPPVGSGEALLRASPAD